MFEQKSRLIIGKGYGLKKLARGLKQMVVEMCHEFADPEPEGKMGCVFIK